MINKTLALMLMLFVNFSFYGQDLEELELNHKLDSLKIDYKPSIQPYLEYKSTITDFFNMLILNGDYSAPILKEFIADINSKQKFVVFSANMTSEKKAIEIKNDILKSIGLTILAKKYGLVGNELKRLADLEDEKNLQRVLRFLRETNYSPIDFKKLKPEEQRKLVIDFENRQKTN